MMELFRTVSFIVGICTSLYIVEGQGNPQCEGMKRGRNILITFTGYYEGDTDTIQLSLLVVALTDNTTSVTVSSKFDSFQSTFEIEPMGFSWLSIPSEFALGMKSERSNKVIQVVADNEISVYGLNYQRFSTGGILGIPTDNLEDNVQMETEESIDSPSLFAVVGVKEGYTQVVANLTTAVTYDGQTYAAGRAIEFNVTQNEVVQIVSDSDESPIEGITVESDKPIVVFSGYACSSSHGSPCDNVPEGEVAINSRGRSYVYNTAGSSDDSSFFAILAYYSDTVVNFPDSDPVTLQPGEYLESDVTTDGTISISQLASTVQVEINQDRIDPSNVKIIPGCSLVSCPVVGLMQNIAVEVSGYSPGSTLRFTCAEGYTLIGSSQVECDESGVWSPEFPECTRDFLFESWLVGIIIACCSGTLIVVVFVVRAVKESRKTSSYSIEQPE